jgi:endonuclease/exonuclease/phosphatase family metal-dependent hydrolase
MTERGRHRWRWACAALAGAALLGRTVLDGLERQATGVAAGIGPQVAAGAAAEPGDRLVVAQFNIRRGLGPDLEGRGALGPMAECLAGIDVAGLNEVDGGWPFGLAANQAAGLGRRLGLGAVFAPTERRLWHPHFGNALLSAWPVHGWVRLPLPFEAGPARRNLLYARIGAAEDPIRVVVTHIDRKGDHDRQLAAALAFFRGLEPPVVLLGDLNATLDHPRIAGIVAEPGVVASNGWHPPQAAAGVVDWILARGFRAVRAERCRSAASDHARIALELERMP